MNAPLTNLVHRAGYESFRFLDGLNGRPFTVIQTGRAGGETYQYTVDVPQDVARRLHAGLLAIGYRPATV